MCDPASTRVDYAVVVPTIGRSSLQRLLTGLAGQQHPPVDVVVVDDRAADGEPLSAPATLTAVSRTRVVRGGGRGPAAARNLGWQLTDTPWVVFADDDVELPPEWSAGLRRDLAEATADTAGVQAVVEVPLPHRRPTDWERNTAALATARWITAEMAFRRTALDDVAGFDERFQRAYREDSDLALRLLRAGWQLRQGDRRVVHPVRPAAAWASVRAQRGNADDALMRRLHGPSWRVTAGAGRGRMRSHLVSVTLGAVATGGALSPHSRWGRRAAFCGAVGWAVTTGQFAVRRIARGPCTIAEVARMALTTPVIPWCAVMYAGLGRWRHRHSPPWPLAVRAVLFDRDGTLIENEVAPPDPGTVRPVAGAVEAVRRLRAHGIATGVVTNQAGIGDGRLAPDDVVRRNAAVDKAIGPLPRGTPARTGRRTAAPAATRHPA